jgi:lambda repressor-like predicted transcriptional regulator
VSRPTDHKRHRLIAELRAAGMSLREIGDRFGVTWQGVQQR